MKVSECVEILKQKKSYAELQLSGGCVGGQYEGIVKAIDEICDCIDLLVVNNFIPFVSETRTYLPEAIEILETEKQDTIFAILVTEDDQMGIEKIPAMQEFVLAADIALYLVKRYFSIFVEESNPMKFLSNYKGHVALYHNGARVLECNKGETVLKFISAITSVNSKIHPSLIVNEFLDNCTDLGGERILIVYQMLPTYMESFLIETY